MAPTYYSVEQVSEMLGLHQKTVQRYIREGKLQATKLGKSWRINGHDLSLFAEGDKPHPAIATEKGTMGTITTSTVIEIPVSGKEMAIYLTNTFSTGMQTQMDGGITSMHIQYLEQQQVIKVMASGPIAFLEHLLRMARTLAEQQTEN